MARANNNGWDFIKVGKTYQYKEEIMPGSAFLGEVTILEDNSNEDEYAFKLQTEKSNMQPPNGNGIFEVSHTKNMDGIYSGMPQFYEQPEYSYKAIWERVK